MITVLIPTSPIPSHPATAILEETISNVRKYTDAEIIILFDGVHPSLEHRREDYEKYVETVTENIDRGDYGNCRHLTFLVHTHQARMTRIALKHIETPLILFVEHDTSPIGEIPFKEICQMVAESKIINYCRFNIFHETPREHAPLMISERIFELGIPIVRTIQWSQRPHIAKADWYRDILEKHFGHDHKTMIEDVMHSVVQVSYDTLNEDRFGLSIYAPEGNQLRSYHSDARGSDTKIIEG